MAVPLALTKRLPRTMLRRGPDVYVLPSYDGLRRIRDPRITAGGSVLAIISEDADAVQILGLEEASDILGQPGLRKATLVADGDWIYVYLSGVQRPARIGAMLDAIDQLARAVPGRRWPIPGETHTSVYGAV